MLVPFYTKEIVLTHSQEAMLEDIKLGSFNIFRATCIFQLKWSVKLLEGFWSFLLILKYHLVGVWKEIPPLNQMGEKSRRFTAPWISSSLFRVTYCCGSLSTSFYYTGLGLVGSCVGVCVWWGNMKVLC